MTKQEIFDKVARHLRKQGRPSTGTGIPGFQGGCAYRGPDGLKCAIGCLLEDKFYDPKMEGISVLNIFKAPGEFTYILIPLLPQDLASPQDAVLFLDRLQQVHDQAPTEWNGTMFKDLEFELKKFAEMYRLEVPA